MSRQRAFSRPGPACVVWRTLVLASPDLAPQDALNLNVTETLTTEYRADNQNDQEDDDKYGIVINRLNVTGTQGHITASVRADSTWFVEPPTEDYVDDILRLERLTATYRLNDWEFVAGDSYAQLGRGILLSLRKSAEVGLDVALRGGQLSLNNNTHGFSLFGGLTNPSNLDAIAQRFVEDTNDIVTGASYEFRGLDLIDFGVMGLYFEPDERLLEERDWTASTGLFAEMNNLTDWLSIYLEGDFQSRTLAGNTDEGKAGYLTLDLAFGDLAILVEGLYLDAFELRGSRNTALNSRFAYTQPPTLERIDQEVINNRDTLGGRARVEYYFFEIETLVYANGMYRINNIDEPEQLDQLHAYGGAEIFFGSGLSHINFSGGFRTESQSGDTIKSMVHGEVDYLQSLSDGYSLHLTSSNEFRTLQEDDYQRGSTFAGVDLTGVGGLTFEFGYDNQDESGAVRNFFYAGHLFAELGDSIQLRLTGGTQRGGIKCISGVCRDFPEFAGARANVVGRF